MNKLLSKLLCAAVVFASLSAAGTQSANAGWYHHGHLFGHHHAGFHVGVHRYHHGLHRYHGIYRHHAYRPVYRSYYYSSLVPYYYPTIRYHYPTYTSFYSAPAYSSCQPICCDSSPAVKTIVPESPVQQPTPALKPAPVDAAPQPPLPPQSASYQRGTQAISHSFSAPTSRRALDVYGTLRNHETEMAIGNRLFAAQLYHSALTKFQEASRVSPSSGDVYLHEGFAELAMGRYDRAAKVFRFATDIDLKLASSKFSLRDIYSKSEVKKFHLDRLARTAMAKADNPDLMYCLGVFLHFDGQQQRARRFFKEAGKTDLQADHIQVFLNTPKPFRTASVTSSPGI